MESWRVVSRACPPASRRRCTDRGSSRRGMLRGAASTTDGRRSRASRRRQAGEPRGPQLRRSG
eukprot:4179317-Pyramimonas_sp.AAC.1